MSSPPIPTATSSARTPELLASELHQALAQAPLAGVLVFGDPLILRAPGVARTLQDRFGSVPVVGCTTAGEIDGKYLEGHVTAVGFPAADFTIAATVIPRVRSVTLETVRSAVTEVEQELNRHPAALTQSCFAMVLADGLSMAEESLTYLLQGVLGATPLFGGSAGDGLRFGTTEVLSQGELIRDAAVLMLVGTKRPFHVVKTQHFVATDTKLVVTAARAAERVVVEFNGLPAAEEYARSIGVEVSALDPAVYAKHPLMVRMGGSWFVRAIQKVNPDGSLTIYCAIDEGLVLTLGRGIGMVEDLRKELTEARERIGPPQVVLGFDCILRRLEAQSAGLQPSLAPVFHEFKVVGFSTYGEQIGGVHVNQTFTGVAIG